MPGGANDEEAAAKHGTADALGHHPDRHFLSVSAPSFNSFACPSCQALYQVVKVEAGS
jgi:hypothetical protein